MPTSRRTRVLEALTGGDHEREARCWQSAPLATLRSRGERSGLTTFLEKISAELIPLFK